MSCKYSLNPFPLRGDDQILDEATSSYGMKPVFDFLDKDRAFSPRVSISEMIRMIEDSPAPKWNSEYSFPEFRPV